MPFKYISGVYMNLYHNHIIIFYIWYCEIPNLLYIKRYMHSPYEA